MRNYLFDKRCLRKVDKKWGRVESSVIFLSVCKKVKPKIWPKEMPSSKKIYYFYRNNLFLPRVVFLEAVSLKKTRFFFECYFERKLNKIVKTENCSYPKKIKNSRNNHYFCSYVIISKPKIMSYGYSNEQK